MNYSRGIRVIPVLLAAAALIGIASMSCTAATLYVAPESTPTRQYHTGASWSTAYTLLEDALANAEDGDEVWVAAGDYDVPDPYYSFEVPEGVQVFGGFAGNETALSQRDWNTNETTLIGVGGAWEIIAADDSVIDGFTITGGDEGIYTWGSPQISNNKFDSGLLYVGIHCEGGYALIENNEFAGVLCAVWLDNTTARVSNNVFVSCGTGIWAIGADASGISNNTVVAGEDGIVVDGYGIVAFPEIANNIIACNNGTGIAVEGQGDEPALSHNCVYDNGTDYDGIAAGATDISSAPGFLSDGIHIPYSSPCRDAGDDTCVLAGDVDMDAQARLIGQHTDIGADEFFDDTPPTAPVVSDDGACQSSTSSLNASWSSSDTESGIAEYKYAVGTTPTDPGAGYLIAWTSAGNNTSVSLSSLSLTEGWTYYFYVKARNSHGSWSNVGFSNGIAADSAYAETGNGYVDMNLIRGWDKFEFSADTTWHYESPGPPSTSTWGTKAKNDSIDAVAPAWTRHTGTGVEPVQGTAVYKIESGAGVDGTNCQYFALKELDASNKWGRIRLTVPVDNNAQHALHTGDYYVFGAQVKMEDYSGVPVAYKIGTDYSSGGGMQKTLSPTGSFSSVELYTGSQGSEVYPQVPAGATRVNVYLEIRTTGGVGEDTPAIYVDDAYVKVVNRVSGEGYEKVLVPAPRNRSINRHLVFWQPTYNNYELACGYDAMITGESRYPQALQIKAYNPTFKAYCYEPGLFISDYRNTTDPEHPVDQWYCCPIGLQWVIDNNEDWLYPKYGSESGYAQEGGTGAYYVDIANEGYAEAWNDYVYDHIVPLKPLAFDGVFIDAAIAYDDDEDGFAELPPSSYQEFLHRVVPALKDDGLTVVQNCCGVHLKTGYNPMGQYPWTMYLEQGLIYFDPTWNTNSPNYTQGYEDNDDQDGTDTPDHFYQESSFIGTWAGYYTSQWVDCLNDMETVARWNDERTLPDKYMHMLTRWNDTIQDPVRNLSDPVADLNCWGHFAVCSYLLAQSQYTTLQVAVTSPNYFPVDVNLSSTNLLGAPSQATPPGEGHFWSIPGLNQYLRTREYANGIVVVNGDTSQAQYTPTSVIYEEVTGTAYGPGTDHTSVTLDARTGRIFFYSNPNP